MSETFLDKIVAATHRRMSLMLHKQNQIKEWAHQIRGAAAPHRFETALKRSDRTNIIAEIKKASPSKGVINDAIDVAEVARAYESGGAAAISVLTEPDFFAGSLEDLISVSAVVGIPILRKDFIVSELQVYEAAAGGADALLLIVAAMPEAELGRLYRLARDLGMDVLVEVHTTLEMAAARNLGAGIIGVNNRDLQTLEVSLDVSRNLILQRPPSALMVAESGISTRDEIEELKALGFNGFLIGETLMRSGDPGKTLGEWV